MTQQQIYRHSFTQPQFSLDVNDNNILTSSFDLEQPNTLSLTKFEPNSLNPFQKIAFTPIHFPPTAVKFLPQNPDIFLTSSDCLRIYKHELNSLTLIAALKPDFLTQAPLLSLSIPRSLPHLCATTSSDGLLSLFDISRFQMISVTAVCNKSAQDVCEYQNNTFLVSTETGEIRVFDPRNPKTSSVICQSNKAVVKVRCDDQNVWFLEADTNYVSVTDIRFAHKIEQLKKHDKAVQSISLGEKTFVSTGNDGKCFMWRKDCLKAVMSYGCSTGVQNCAVNDEFCYLLSGNQLECLRIGGE